jgi:diaminohydroxyphosphoribosylaminopyrimidine deaminase / 5-amino-6-(5-phosphoribosylamino)uracil reductase
MKRAIALARRARGDVNHYPMVGAVIVKKGKKISEGYFRKPGEPHAEVHALRRAGKKAKGADIYVNLEPCSHLGTTPPCADAVIKAGIKRVVTGMKDPNPLVAGKGYKKLQKAKIEVVENVLHEESKELNRAFTKFITTNTPYVIMKVASTLDGKIATKTKDSFWVSCEESRKEAHRLRDIYQSIMVGAGTLRSDDPSLTVRMSGKGRHPRPVIVSTDLDIPIKSKIFSTPAEGGPIFFCTGKATKSRVKKIEDMGAKVITVRQNRQKKVDLKAVISELGKLKIGTLLVEGGGGNTRFNASSWPC